MDRQERETRRDTFLSHADDYLAARPGYPEELLDTALSRGALTPGMSVLEVGCGTGQLTTWLAKRGLNIRAIDRSPEMVALAMQRLAPFPNVTVHCEDFEVGARPQSFAGLFFGTSYHWLHPASRVGRCAESLDVGGALILLWHVHPLPYTGFFERVEPIYQRLFPGQEAPVSPGMSEQRIRGVTAELVSSGRFVSISRHGHDWERVYDRDLYLRLLDTYSDHRRLPELQRRALYGELSAIIDREYSGHVTRPYRTELVVARRG